MESADIMLSMLDVDVLASVGATFKYIVCISLLIIIRF